MKQILKLTACLLSGLLATAPAIAREPGTPPDMPPGATMGVPVGANFPVPGFYLSSRTAAVRGTVHDANGNATGPDLNVNATALQLHWTPGIELLGGTYRAMGIVALQNLDLSLNGIGLGANTSISDLSISPLNIHWMVEPGIFTSAGLSFGLPTGEFHTNGTPNGGDGAASVALDAGFSYLRDGWNLSLHGNYFINAENSTTKYRSGHELLLNWTGMKAVGASGWSLGTVGYWRKQVTDDRNKGAFYGGTTAGRAQETGIGLAVAKRVGGTELYVDYTWNTSAKNIIGADMLRFNVTFPLGGKK